MNPALPPYAGSPVDHLWALVLIGLIGPYAAHTIYLPYVPTVRTGSLQRFDQDPVPDQDTLLGDDGRHRRRDDGHGGSDAADGVPLPLQPWGDAWHDACQLYTCALTDDGAAQPLLPNPIYRILRTH